MMALDLKQAADVFTGNISSAVESVTSQDIASIAGFAQQQLQALANQSALVAGMIEANAFTDAEKDFYLDGLKQMAQHFVDTFQQIAALEIQTIYNGIVQAIYASISKLSGIALAAV
jgi:hypothetical protein